jgi:hypothetical protein
MIFNFLFLNNGSETVSEEVLIDRSYFGNKKFIEKIDLVKIVNENFQIDISNYDLSEFKMSFGNYKWTIHLKHDDYDKIRDFKLRKILEKSQF